MPNMFSFDGNLRKFSLDNGLRVALLNTSAQTVHARLRVNYGALHELPGEEGRVHMLEHVLITGGNVYNSLEEADDIIDTLGSVNASTDLDRTHFYASMLPNHLPLGLQFLADNIFNPRLDSERVAEEVQRAMREKEDFESTPFFSDVEHFAKTLLGDGPHTYDMAGSWGSLETTDRESLLRIYGRGFFANNMILYVVGALPDDAESMVRKIFSVAPSGQAASFEFPSVDFLKRFVYLHADAPDLQNKTEPEKSKAYFGLGVVVPPNRHPDTYPVRMLANVLGDTGFSRLFKRMSQRQGLTYWVDATYDGSNNKGIFEVSAQIASSKLEETLDTIFGEISHLREYLIDERELERLRGREVFHVAEQFEDKIGLVELLERNFDDGLTPDEYLHRMLAVNPQQIREAANKYLPRRDGNYVLFLRDPNKAELPKEVKS